MKTKICSKCGVEKLITEFIPCKKGKFGARGECKACKKKYDSVYNRENRKANAARERKYRGDHKEQIAKQKLKWQRSHKKSYVKSNAKYIGTVKGKASLARRNSNRKTKEKGVKNTLTSNQFKEIICMQNNLCADCGRKFTDELKPTRDHIIPVYLGGALTFGNVQALCRPCNSRKRNKIDFGKAISEILVEV